jgi:molecular chaperone DnaK
MVQEAEVNAEADKKQRSLIEARNQAEASVHSLRTDMKEVESSLTDEQKTAIEDAIKAVEDAKTGDDVEAIQKATSNLFTVGMPVMEAKTKAEQAASQPKPNEDGIVDAEFTEVKDKT